MKIAAAAAADASAEGAFAPLRGSGGGYGGGGLLVVAVMVFASIAQLTRTKAANEKPHHRQRPDGGRMREIRHWEREDHYHRYCKGVRDDWSLGGDLFELVVQLIGVPAY